MATHIAIGRIDEVYNKDLKDTIYQICGCQDEQWEMISTKKDTSIAAFIQKQKPTHSSPGEPNVHRHDRSEEVDD